MLLKVKFCAKKKYNKVQHLYGTFKSVKNFTAIIFRS